jgi:hypothetical protein
MATKFADTGWIQTLKFFSSQNHIENFVLIILGRFPVNETQTLISGGPRKYGSLKIPVKVSSQNLSKTLTKVSFTAMPLKNPC